MPEKKKKRSLAETHPDIAKEADGWDPTSFSFGSNSRVSWKCKRGHLFESVIAERTRGKGCPFCAGRRVLSGFNDLATTHPDLAKEALGWDPTTISAGSHKKLLWRCSLGHETVATVKNRALLGNKCRICMNQEAVAGFNDFLTASPELALEAHGWNPATIVAGTNKKYEWRCPKGHIYLQSPSQRLQGQGCNVCASKKILVGSNDLATTHPLVASEALGWNPKEYFGGSHQKKKFRCPTGHEYVATIKDRTVKGSSCPTCAKTGFDPNQKGWLYFLLQSENHLYQIGITNYPNDRLRLHQNKGWELIELRGPMDGLLAKQWESAILRHIKEKGGQFANEVQIEPFDGYTESWLKKSFHFESLKEIMSKIDLEEDE